MLSFPDTDHFDEALLLEEPYETPEGDFSAAGSCVEENVACLS